MIQKIKDFFKMFLPPPTKAFNREIERVLGAIEKQEERHETQVKKLEQEIVTLKESQKKQIAGLQESQKKQIAGLQESQKKEIAGLQESQKKEIRNSEIKITSSLKKQELKMSEIKKEIMKLDTEITYLVAVTIRESAIDHKRFQKVYNFAKDNEKKLNNYDWLSSLESKKYNIALAAWYFNKVGEWVDLEEPKTINEKIQWLKLNDSTPKKTRLADKYLVREWLVEKIGEQHLIPLLGIWEKFEDIEFEKLPNRFVLKATHGSGFNFIVQDKSSLDYEVISQKFNDWLSYNYAFKHGFELQYLNITPRIIAEMYIENIEQYNEYEVVCTYGEVISIWVGCDRKLDNDRVRNQKQLVYDSAWNVLPVELRVPKSENYKERPINFDKMIRISNALSLEFALVRIDFYEIKDTLYVGELTFTTSSGTSRAKPREYERIWGDMIKLPEKSPLQERIADN